MKDTRGKAIILAFLAALFYAVNVPCSKVLLSDVAPTFMAAFLYLGAGLGVGIMYLFRFKNEKRSDKLDRTDIPYTIGMVVLDIIAPILLMMGISTGSAANASLLGNFEIVATTLIAFVIFKEKSIMEIVDCHSIGDCFKHYYFFWRNGQSEIFNRFTAGYWSHYLLGT